jgi:hypothetical protein
MGFITGSGNASSPTYTGLSLQTSAQGIGITLVWGVKRLAPNLIYYTDFSPHRDKKGLGKGGEGKNPINKYTVAVIFAICEGPIVEYEAVWQDKTVLTIAQLGFTPFLGSATQAPWSYVVSNHPTQARSYARTAYVANSAYDLGRSQDLPNHNFEVVANINGSGFFLPNATRGGVDMNMADVLQDFLTNVQYSIGLPTSVFGSSLGLYRAYCTAQGLLFSPDITSQEQVSSVLDRWAQISNSWIFWSGNGIKVVPLGDSVCPPAFPYTETYPTSVPLVASGVGMYGVVLRPGLGACTDLGVTDQITGAAFTPVGGGPTQGQYQVLGSVGSLLYFFSAADAGRLIKIKYSVAANIDTVTYTPNVTPVADLGYDDFIVEQKGEPPVICTRVDPADAVNHVRLECKDRNAAYNSGIAEWKDQGLVDDFGLIDAPQTQAYEICDLSVGNRSAQLIGQRLAYLRNTYEFKIGIGLGSTLEPGDIVTLTESHIGLTLFAVRIKQLDEDDKNNWQVTAEEFPGGVGTITPASTQSFNGPVSTTVNSAIAPGHVNPPGIFEPASSLTHGVAQLWVAASGGKNWGGCLVYISLDNVNYTNIGTITRPAIQGVLTATLASHADPDTVNTLALDTTESNIAFPTDVAHADADAFRTLSLVTPAFSTVAPANGECIAYGAAATTGAFTVGLSYLRRGLYGTAPGAHASGAYFTRFDLSTATVPVANTMLIQNMPPQYIGQPIFLKFASFNTFGGGAEDLSTVTAYSYTPSGAGFGGGANGVPTTPGAPTAITSAGQNTLSWTPNPLTDNVTQYSVYRAAGLGAAFSAASLIGITTSPNYVDAGLTGGTAYTYFVVADNVAGNSTNSTGTSVTTGASGPIRYDIDSWMYGAQTVATQLIRRFESVRTVTIPTTGHQAGADTAATASTVFTLLKNGTSVGTVTFAASATTGTFSIGSPFSLAAADVFEIRGPATADATLANVNIILAGTA